MRTVLAIAAATSFVAALGGCAIIVAPGPDGGDVSVRTPFSSDVVQGDGIPADRPLGHAEIGRSRAAVHDRPALQQLEERE